MDYVGVAEEEGGEPIEIPVEEDGTGMGGTGQQTWHNIPLCLAAQQHTAWQCVIAIVLSSTRQDWLYNAESSNYYFFLD